MDFHDRIRDGEFKNNIDFSTDREAYRAEERRVVELFKVEALKDLGLEGHAKAEKVWQKAWDDGHSSGYEEVYGHLVDLADIVL